MPSQDKREQMMRRRPQRSEAGESPDFKAAFRDTSESKKKLTRTLRVRPPNSSRKS